MPYKDPAARREFLRRYRSTEEFKAKRRARRSQPEVREREREKGREYDAKRRANASPEKRATWREYSRKFRERNPDYAKQRYWQYTKADPDRYARVIANNKVSSRRAVLRMHGLSMDEYDALLRQQKKRCAICRTDDPGSSKDWRIDHCHRTNKVRGLLCHNCNVSLGLMKDSKRNIQRMLDYLKGTKR